MFQISSEGTILGGYRYVRTPEVSEFGSVFWLAANFTWDVPLSPLHFFKPGPFRDLFERFESPTNPQLIFLARLGSMGMGFRACCSPPLPRPLAVGFSSPRVLAIDSSLMSLLRKATRCSPLYLARASLSGAHSSRKPRVLRGMK